MTFRLQVSDDGLDGGTAAQLAFDDPEDAAPLAGDEDATWVLHIVSAISFVDIGALDRAAGERLGLGALDDVAQGVTVIRAARQCFGVQHEQATWRLAVIGDDGGLHTEFVRRSRLAFADALDLRGVEGIELPAALALLLRADLCVFQRMVSTDFR